MYSDKYIPESVLIESLNDPSLTLVMDQCEIERILNDNGLELSYGCLFVKVKDGEYKEIWASKKSIPWVFNSAYPLILDGVKTSWCKL